MRRFRSFKDEKEFLARCSPIVRSNVRGYAACEPSLRDDLIQEAWVAIIEALDNFDESRGYKFESYANSVVRGRLYHFWRSKKDTIRPVRHQPRKDGKIIEESIVRAEIVCADKFESPELFYGFSDFSYDDVDLSIVLDQLPPECKFVLVRFFYHGETRAEIARNCKISQPVIGRLYDRGISLLRDMLTEGSYA